MARKDKDDFSYEYDPIKELSGGKKAEKVVWSTYSINAAVEGLKKGLPLKANPFIGKVTKLLKPDLVYKRTKEEIDDYIKCKHDPVYFASKCYLMTPDGLKPVILRDYQVEYLRHLHDHRFSIFLSCRQSGKSLNMLSNIWIKTTLPCKGYVNLLKKYNFYIEDNSININIPIFELYHLLDSSFIGNMRYHLYKILAKITPLHESHDNKLKTLKNTIKKLSYTSYYKLISLLDNFDYKFIHNELTDGYKTIKEIPINDIEVLTDTGYKAVTNFLLTKPFEQYIIKLENGYELNCADRHIFFTEDYNEVFCEDLHIGEKIITDEGPKKITYIDIDYTKISMCDISVNDDKHRFYSNGILSHNSTTTAIYCLWVILFNMDKQGLILSKSGPAGADLLKKIKDMYMFLPYHLKCGTLKWNQGEISFDNNSPISTESSSPTAGLGKTINFLILDEFAWCPPNDVELFYNNIIPTISADTTANICIMSTQNGFNLFYKIYKAAVEGKNIYSPFKVDWNQVPMWDGTTKSWKKRDEKWKQEMIGILGSEEAFYYQYGTQFSISDNCIVSRECMSKIHERERLFNAHTDKEYQDAGISLTLQHLDCLKFDPQYNLENLRTDKFVILDDLAEGGGGDYTVFHILKIAGKDEFEQVAYWHSNKVDLEHSALDFWLLVCQLFNNGNSLISIEWNTYGALFYTYLKNYNEQDYDEENMWRYNIPGTAMGIDLFNIVKYKKESIEAAAAGKKRTTNFVPGIKFSGGNKHVACSMLKMMLEKDKIKIYDIVTINQLENFEDRTGNGSYAAKIGHDDIVMTLCQIPMMQQTTKFKEFISELESTTIIGSMQSKMDMMSGSVYGNTMSPWQSPYGGGMMPPGRPW